MGVGVGVRVCVCANIHMFVCVCVCVRVCIKHHIISQCYIPQQSPHSRGGIIYQLDSKSSSATIMYVHMAINDHTINMHMKN